jgi:vacuolar-type H+-ATPase subunit I/STV1
MTEESTTQSATQKPVYKKWGFWMIAIFTIFIIISMSSTSNEIKQVEKESKPVEEVVEIQKDTTEKSFSEKVRIRFDEIENAWKEDGDELDNIECYNNDCSSVAYFHFNSIPEDLESFVRLNTATFSNFKLKEKGVSNVTIFATYNGRTIFQCDGAKGMVTACK